MAGERWNADVLSHTDFEAAAATRAAAKMQRRNAQIGRRRRDTGGANARLRAWERRVGEACVGECARGCHAFVQRRCVLRRVGEYECAIARVRGKCVCGLLFHFYFKHLLRFTACLAAPTDLPDPNGDPLVFVNASEVAEEMRQRSEPAVGKRSGCARMLRASVCVCVCVFVFGNVLEMALCWLGLVGLSASY